MFGIPVCRNNISQFHVVRFFNLFSCLITKYICPVDLKTFNYVGIDNVVSLFIQNLQYALRQFFVIVRSGGNIKFLNITLN